MAPRRLFLRVLVIAVVGIAVFLWFRLNPPPARIDYRRGVELAAAEMWPEAQSAWMQAIREDPRYDPSYRQLAESYEKQGDAPDAVAAWRALVQHVPHARHAWCRLAEDEAAAGMEAPALHDAETELKQDPSCATANLVAGQILAGTSLQTEALSRLKIAIGAFPGNIKLRLLYGKLLAKDGRYAQAVPQLQFLISHNPSLAEAHYWLGYALARGAPVPDLGGAERELKQAIALQASYPEAAAELGRVEQSLGRPARAIDYLQESIQEQPHQPSALFSLAGALRQLGRTSEAAAVVQRFQHESDLAQQEETLQRRYAVDRSEDTAIALAKLELQLNKPAGAIRAIQESLAKHPNDPRLLELRDRAGM